MGSSSHFAAELLRTQAGIELVNIPFKSIGEALTEVIAGRVQFHIAPYISAIRLAKEGKLRALAVTGKRRIAELPDVPTVGRVGPAGLRVDLLVWPARVGQDAGGGGRTVAP
jgi:tripartite-type tricarboxylate transporter receptor subunit TctC